MIIETKYNIGYKFWVPRVIKQYLTDQIDKNGLTYTRSFHKLQATARQKIVTRISIELLDNFEKIKYYSKNVDTETAFSSYYNETEMQFNNELEALAFANKWLEKNQTEYFGEPKDEY